ncbi:MAG: hypothetical protein P4L81_02710 [Candidatus Pacebacteria bacterium]|nr:hypothetical protein [Candidatus Paceibacterota bacterium]
MDRHVLTVTIDCAARPCVPDHYSLVSHQLGATIAWDRNRQRDALYVSSKGDILGTRLRRELTRNHVPVLNARVIDHLLLYQGQIPEEWRRRRIHFWGTIYNHKIEDGRLAVRYLWWDHADHRWRDGVNWIGNLFTWETPVAIFSRGGH